VSVPVRAAATRTGGVDLEPLPSEEARSRH
jgi:hypothetical protein